MTRSFSHRAGTPPACLGVAARAIFLAIAMLLGTGDLARADEAAVLKRMQERFPQSLVERVFKTPFPGLYEVVMDQKLLYTDEQVSFIMVGNLIDARSNQNLTQQRLRRLNAIDWKQLPLELAFRKVKGDGSRRIAIFSDPLCPHCVNQEKELARLTNVTIYTFLYPIERLHPGATARSRAVWCSSDRQRAWDDLVLKGVEPKAKPCPDPLKRIEELGARLKVNVTPTLILGDGTVVSGGLLATQLEKLLADAERR